MLNRTQNKIIFIMASAALIMITGLYVSNINDQKNVTLLIANQSKEKEVLLAKIIELKSIGASDLVYDYTYWDQMVNFVKTGDPDWAEENIEASVSTFGVDLVWIYRPDFSIMYTLNETKHNTFDQLPLSPSALKDVCSSKPFSHFFLNTERGILEIFGASVHPTDDEERTTAPSGYLFVGTFWTESYINEISKLVEADIKIVPPIDIEKETGSEQFTVKAQYALQDAHGDTAAFVLSKSQSIMAKAIQEQTQIEMLVNSGNALISLILLFFILQWLINHPLHLLTTSLEKHDPSLIQNLALKNNEFGKLAVMLRSFFDQKKKLIDDINIQKQTEKALREREEMFKAAFDNAPTGMYIMAPDRSYLAVNPLLCKMFGYTQEELLGQTYQHITHPDDKALSDEWVSKKISGKSCEPELEKRYIHKDGHIVWALVRAEWIKNADGSPLMAISHVFDITARKEAADAIRQNEEKYRSIFENIQDVYFETALDGTIMELSPSIETLVKNQYKRSELIGRRIYDFYDDPNDKEKITKLLQESGFVKNYEIQFKIKDGSIAICSATIKFLFDAHNQPIKIIGSLHDMTDRKKAEKELHIKEFAIESSVSGIVLSNLEGKIIYANKAFADMWGYDSAEELLNKHAYTFTADKSMIDEVISAVQSGVTFINERQAQKKDGTLFDVQMSANMVQSSDGKPICMMGSFIDITERKRAEDEVHESEERYRLMITNSNDLIQSINPDGSIQYVNPTWCYVLGYNLEEAANLNLFDIVYPDSLSHCKASFEKLFQGEKIPHIEVTFIAKNKKLVYLEGNAAPRVMDGKVIATQAFFHDVTERKQGEEALLFVNRRLRTLQTITDSVYESLDLSTIFERITDAIVNAMGFTTALVVTLDKEGEKFHVRSLSSSLHYIEAINKILGFSLKSFTFSKTNIVKDLKGDNIKKNIIITKHLSEITHPPLSKHISNSLQKLSDNKNYILIPLVRDKKLIGGIVVTSTMVEIPKTDIEMLETFAATAIQAITNADLLANSELAKEQIQRNLKEKEILLRELYHRTKNNMQVISSMLRIRSNNITNPDVKDILSDLNNKIRSMAMAHQKLYDSKDLSHLNLKEYFQSLIDIIRGSYGFLSNHVTFAVKGEDVHVLIDMAIPCGLVINELITNSLKHAFPDNKQGKIEVDVYLSKKKELILEISDNGVGLPAHFDLEQDTSLGLKSVIDLVEYQLQGEIKCKNNNGVSWHIAIKKSLYKPRI